MNLRTLHQCMIGITLAATTWAGSLDASASESAPQRIVHSGRMFDAQGNPLVDIAHMKLSLYDARTGGRALWSETVEVDFDDGHFAVTLGESTPLPAAFLDGKPRWLGLALGGRPEQPARVLVKADPAAPKASPAQPAARPAEPPRPAGVVLAAAFAESELGTLVNTSEYTFIGATLVMTVEDSQLAHVTANADFGSTARGGADGLVVSACARPVAGTQLIEDLGSRIENITVAESIRRPVALKTRFAGLAAGDYEFGMCGAIKSQTNRWNDNDASRVTVMITAL